MMPPISREHWRRSVSALAILALANCSTPDRPAAEVQPATTVQTKTETANGPIELRRFSSSINSDGAHQQVADAIYAGTGMLYTPSPKGAATADASEGDVSLDFVNADVREVAKSILGDLLGLNYLVDSSVQGTITVQANQKLPKDQVLPAFETVLKANGLALVRQGQFYSIVPYGSAARAGDSGARGAGYGTEIITLHYVSPEQMRKVVEPLAPQGTILEVDQTRNLMVIGGTDGERAAIREQIATFDADWLKGMSFALFRPKVATAKQMADDLKHVMGDENSTMAGLVRLIPIERMNAVLAIAPQARYLEELRGWVTRLDQGNDTTERRIFVYYVQNGRANDLARVLGRALGIRSNAGESDQGSQSSYGQSGYGSRGFSSGSFGQQSSGFGGSGFQSTPSAYGSQVSGGSAFGGQGFGQQGMGSGFTSSANARERSGNGSSTSTGSSSDLPEASTDQQGGMSITADEVNNALLVVATPAEYEIIEQALKKLDILPLQVLIEAAIAEVTLTKDLNLGVQWKFNNGTNQVTLSGGSTRVLGQAFPGLSYLYSSGTRISAVLNALQDVTHVDVLSAPKLMVLNNQTATLQVGDQVPIATQSSVSTLTSDAPVVNSIEYKDTGVILSVTPRVNEGGLVLMDISQEVSDVATTTSSTLNSPTINERKIGSTVAIQDGETIALGGLIRDNRSTGRSGVPYLQNIPILGQIFRQDTGNTTRTELLVLLTPRVVRDGRDAAAITAELRAKLTDLREEFVPVNMPKPKMEPPAQ